MGKRKYKADIAGQRFGRLVANKPVGEDSNKTPFWECSCDCGSVCKIRFHSLVKGTTQSCGCLHREVASRVCFKHGQASQHKGHVTSEYRAYVNAKRRCRDPKSDHWKYYGGRGIEFRFDSFEQFFAELGPKPGPEYSIDRADNDGHYEPGNVRWATKSQQVLNRRKLSKRDGKGKHGDLTGRRFGRLLVDAFIGRNNYRHPLWKCTCDCGERCTVNGYALVSDRTNSCGCLQSEVASRTCTLRNERDNHADL